MLMFDDEPELLTSELSSISGSYQDLRMLKPLVLEEKAFTELPIESPNEFTDMKPYTPQKANHNQVMSLRYYDSE
jgi:hypothetical protein